MPSYLSYSQLALYLECPLKYKLRYLSEGGYGDELVPAALAFGSAIHQALAHFYRQTMDGEPFNLAGFLAVFAAAWEAEVEKKEVFYDHGEDFASLLALGQEMLKVFARSAHPLKVIAVEVPFEFKLEHPRTGEEFPIPIKGIIDLIEEDEQGTLWIVDHKTAGRAYSEQQIAGDLQMLIYAAAVKQLDVVEGREVLLRLDVLLKGKQPQVLRYCLRREERDISRLFEIVTGIWRAIEAEAFYPRCCIYCRWGAAHEECQG
jgi:ATP-dependent helicase/DNAse subunit B